MASIKTANASSTDKNIAAGGGAGGPGSDIGGAGGVMSMGAGSGFGNAVYQISFNPTDNTQLCVIGNGLFKLYRYSEGMLKLLPTQKMEPRV